MFQLSIFLENKMGRLPQVMELIGKENIRIVAAMIADTSEYGILRLITTDTQSAYRALKDNNISANVNEVVAIITDSRAGALFDVLRCFSIDGVEIEYMYSFSVTEQAILIMRVSDVDKAIEIIRTNNIQTLSSEDLSNL